MILDKTYWQERYKNGSTAWDLGHASQPIANYIATLKDKKQTILVPGAGNAHEAILLYKLGFKNVTVLDFAQEPLDKLNDTLPLHHGYNLVCDDFFNHVGLYDLILEQTFFCALEVRFRESYFKQTHSLLNKQGILAGLLFYFEQNNPGPPFTCSPKEYAALASPLFNIDHLQPCTTSEPSRAGKELFLQLSKRTNEN